jgi:hypothetical protein
VILIGLAQRPCALCGWDLYISIYCCHQRPIIIAAPLRLFCSPPDSVRASWIHHHRTMAIPVARVHLAVAHAALPALVPTPPKCEMLPLLPTPCVAVVLPKPLAKPSRADSDERWDARKTMTGLAASTDQSSTSSSPRSTAGSVWSSARRRGSASRKIATTPPKPGRADSDERWDVRKTMTGLAASTDQSSASSTSSPRSTADSVWSSAQRRGSSCKSATAPRAPQARPS